MQHSKHNASARSRLGKRSVVRAAMASAVCCGLAFPAAALASQYTFTGPGDGLWTTAANWTLNGGSTHAVPVNGDDAFLGTGGNATQVIFNGNYTGAGLNSLTLNSPDFPQIALFQNVSGSATVAVNESIGTTVSANFYEHSAGTNTATNLFIGPQPGGEGEYDLSGSGVLSTVNEMIGSTDIFQQNGSGFFSQTGGTNNVLYNLDIGSDDSSKSSSSYTMTGGTLNLTATGQYLSEIAVLGNGGPPALFNQSGGTVNGASNNYSTISVGGNGSSYILSGTGKINNIESLSIGSVPNSATFIQDAGTAQNLGPYGGVSVGSSSSYGTYTMNGGTLTTNSLSVGTDASEYSNDDTLIPGLGIFQQSGGTVTLTAQYAENGLAIGTLGADGEYYLSGSGILTVSEGEIIGSGVIGYSEALFDQSGGTHTISGGLEIGQYNSSGAYLMSAGLLTVTGNVNIGGPATDYASGIFGIDGAGTVNVSGGVISLGNNSPGAEGLGLMNQSAGTVNTPGLLVGNTSAGTYELNATSAVLNVTGNETVGVTGPGDFEQSAGTHTVYSSLILGGNAGSAGTFNLSGGTLTVYGELIVGNSGNGTFGQIGNANLNVSGTAYIGYAGNGIFNQSAGNTTIGGTLYMGCTSAASGAVYLRGGTLSATTVYVGYQGTGLVNQSGGTFNASGSLDVGISASATYILSAGKLNLLSASNLIYPGSTFNQSGGTLSGSLTNDGTFLFSGGGFATGSALTNGGGTAAFNADAGSSGHNNLTVNVSGGTVAFNTTQHLADLNISSGGIAKVTGGGNGHRSMLYTPLLSISGGTLDLTGNDMDVQGGGSAALTAVTALIASAYNNGRWTGAGITSSSAAANTARLTALGVLLLGFGPVSNLDGFSIADGDLLVKYTYYGDADLNGTVDGSDYSRIDNGYLTHATGWYNGDFNYDGYINGSDYTLIDNAYNTQGAQQNAELANPTAELAVPTTSVPEPMSLSLLGITALAMLGRHRKQLPEKSCARSLLKE